MPPPPPMPADAAGLVAELALGVGVIRGGRWVWVNSALATLVGSTPEAMVGREFRDVLVPEERDRTWERYRARLQGEHAPSSYEVTALHADGRTVRLEVEPKLLSSDESLVLVRDLGERVRDSALLGALSELALKVQRARSSQAIVSETCAGLYALGFSTCVVRLETGVVRIVAADMPPEVRARLEGLAGIFSELRFKPEDLARSLEATRPRGFGFFDDFTPFLADGFAATGRPQPADLGRIVRELGIEKVAICPLVANERIWGILYVSSSALRSNDAAALALFAAQVATAIEVASSIENLQRRNAQLEAIHRVEMTSTNQPLHELTPALLRIVCGVVPSDAASLYLLDSEQQALVFVGEVGAESPMPEQYRRVSVAEGPEAKFRDLHGPRRLSPEICGEAGWQALRAAGVHQAATVPLRVGGRFAGILNLTRKYPEPYTDEELHSAELLAGQVAAQVERARLHADAQRRLEELSLMNEVGGLIANNLELGEVLGTAMRHIAQIVDVPNVFLGRLEADGKALILQASNLPELEQGSIRIPLEDPSAAARAIMESRPVAIENLESDPRVARALHERFGHRAMLAVPLLCEGRPVGVLALGETRGPRRFTRSEIDRSVAMANQLASAIDNARLYQAQRRRVEQLRLLLDMGRVITGSLELDPILREAAQALVRMIDATDAFIWFLDGTELAGQITTDPELNAHFSSVRLALSEPSAAAMAIQLRAPVRIEDAMGSPEVSQPLNSTFQQRSLMTIPLMLRDMPIGAIGVGDRRKTRRFTDDDVERALLISRQLAVAIDNARLFEDLKRSYHELSRAQQELVKAERLAALGELSAVVAHEVRNPLGVIFNSLASLRRMVSPSEDAQMLLGIVGEEADRLNRMVGDLLDFARPHEPQLRPESLADVIGGAVESAGRLMAGQPVEFRTEIPHSLPRVPIDAQMIRQAVLNLVGNAVQAMPQGGRVTIRAVEEYRGASSFARVEVEDNGPGIPADLADRVFQPFFTTRAAGTGLGLAVVKRIADAHRAELTLTPTPGGGSTFTLWLPL